MQQIILYLIFLSYQCWISTKFQSMLHERDEQLPG